MKQISSLQNPEIKFLIKLKLKKYQQIWADSLFLEK